MYILLARRIYEAIQDGTVSIGDGWDGVKKGDELPKEQVRFSSRITDVKSENRGGCCN